MTAGTKTPQDAGHDVGQEAFDEIIDNSYNPFEKERLNKIAEEGDPTAADALREGENTFADAAPSSAPTPVAEREAAAPAKQAAAAGQGKGFKANKRGLGRIFGGKKGRRITIWAAGALIVGILGILATLPNLIDIEIAKLKHKNIERIERYINKKADSGNLLMKFLAVYVLGNIAGIESCQEAGIQDFTVTADCFHRANSADMQGSRFKRAAKVWWDNKLHAKLAQAGIDIAYAPNTRLPNGRTGPGWVISMDNRVMGSVDPNNAEADIELLYGEGRREGADLRSRTMERFRDAVKSNFVIDLMIGAYLKNKFGLRTCGFFCKVRDKVDKPLTALRTAKQAMQGILINRVIGSVNLRAGLFVACMFQGTQYCREENREFQDRYRSLIQESRSRLGQETTDNLIKLAEEYAKFKSEGGNLTQFVLRKILGVVGEKVSQALAKLALNVIPIVGQIINVVEWARTLLMIANVIRFIGGAGIQFAKATILMGFYVSSWHTMKVVADEIRGAYEAYPIELRAAQTEILLSETHNFTDSFLWQSREGNPDGFKNFGAVFAKAAYAVDPKAYPMTCPDGNFMPASEVICPDMKLNSPPPVKSAISGIPGVDELANNDTVGSVIDAGNSANKAISDLNPIESPFSGALDAAMKWLLDNGLMKMFQDIAASILTAGIKDADSLQGAMMYDGMAGGAEVTANEILRGTVNENGKAEGLGGGYTTNRALIAAEEEEIKREQEAKFNKLSWFEKIFSKEHEQSVVSQLAYAVPQNVTQAAQIVSPNTLFNIFGMIGSKPAKAIDLTQSPIGMPGYFISQENINTPIDINRNTDCPNDRTPQPLQPGSAGDAGLGRQEITTENPCLLEEAAITAMTAYLTKEPVDPATPTSSSTGGGTGTGTSSGQFGWPIPESDFKTTTDCFGTRGGAHKGIDLVGNAGNGRTHIIAADGGKVLQAGFEATMGNYVMIEHSGSSTVYMHLSATPLVKTGDNVSKGQQLGFMGSTGDSTGPHLHFEINQPKPRQMGGTAVNPIPLLPKLAGVTCS